MRYDSRDPETIRVSRRLWNTLAVSRADIAPNGDTVNNSFGKNPRRGVRSNPPLVGTDLFVAVGSLDAYSIRIHIQLASRGAM